MSTELYCSIFELSQLLNFDFAADPDPALTLCESDPAFQSDAVPNPDTASLKVSDPCEFESGKPVSDPHC